LRLAIAALGGALGLLCAACAPGGPSGEQPRSGGDPPTLSEWDQVILADGRLELGEGVTPYDLNTALFTDYALKLRTVSLPDGAAPAAYDPQNSFDFPVGAVITKTFFYPRSEGGFDHVAQAGRLMDHFDGRALELDAVRLIETRVLVRREDGWRALPYVWNEAQTEARLSRIGAALDLMLVSELGEARPLAYFAPNVNQCAGCHVTDTDAGGLQPIGPKARHLNGDFAYIHGVENQLDHWRSAGLLHGGPAPAEAPRTEPVIEPFQVSELLEAQARGYLDINCAHCHSQTGPADTSGLFLEPWTQTGPPLGLCKPPIAAGRGTGGRLYGVVPGDADASILVHRMESEAADIMMPELGRSVAHAEGVALIAAWVNALPGDCG